MVLEAPFPGSEGAGVIVTATVPHDGRHVVMQHLVKDHGLDEKVWHPRLVEPGQQ